MSYIDTYYRRSLWDDRLRPALEVPEEADVCVVGGQRHAGGRRGVPCVNTWVGWASRLSNAGGIL